MTDRFQLVAPYQPSGDQPQAIARLAEGFEAGLAAAKAAAPGAPAWLLGALEKNKAAIQKACAADHPDPLVIRKLTAADKR